MIEGDFINLLIKKNNNFLLTVFNYIILCSSVIILLFAYKISSDNTLPRYVEDISKDWIDNKGKKVNLEKLPTKDNDSYSITYNAKLEDYESYTIVFMASNCYVDTYVNGKLYEKDVKNQSVIFGKSPGRRWHMINIPTNEVEQNITLEIEGVYDDEKGRIDDIYIGNPSGITKQILKDKTVGVLISVLLVVVGLLMCALYSFVKYNNKARKINTMEWDDKTVVYIGLLTICMGLYSSIETYFLQYMFDNSAIFQLASYLAVFFIGILIGLIGCEILDGKKRIIAKIVYWITVLLFISTSVMNFTGILEYHYVMRYIYIYGAMLSIVVFLEGYVYIKKRSCISNSLLFGVCLFSVTFACDCSRYIIEGAIDVCAYTRIGFLVLVICIFTSCVDSIVRMMQKGFYADLYKQMANTDTLTELNNRNAFILDQGKLNEMIRNNYRIGIAMFDVNDLKHINDTYGHDQGDILIKAAASIIDKSFGEYGKCYRVGGDEFIAVIVNEEAKEIYDKAISDFIKNISVYNKKKDTKHTIQIAYGFYHSDNEFIDQMWQKADELMYEKKRQMKKQ